VAQTKFDPDEFLRRENEREERERANEKTAHKPEPPRPLIRTLPPANPFPVDALGDVLGNAARAINDRVQAPMAICGQSVLATATLAVQGHADTQLPTGHIKPVSSFFLTVAETGERKTAGDSEALESVAKWERELRESYDNDFPKYENNMEAWEEARNKAKKDAKGNQAAIKLAFANIGPKPTPPLIPLLTCPEPTYEGLVKQLAVGQPSIGLFADEGGQFIGGHGMNDEAILRTAAGLSSVWDGKPIKRVRGGDGVTVLPGRRVALHLMAQPDVAAMVLSDSLLLNQGLLSRCLATAPDSIAGSRQWHEPNENSAENLKVYNDRIYEILSRPLPLVAKKNNELAPRVVLLSSIAREMWIAFADKIELQIKPNGLLIPIKGLANKLPEHAARLAAILTLAPVLTATTDVADIKISENEMAAGVILVEHYANEAMRLVEASQVNADLIAAQKLLDWLKSSWADAAVSLPDIYQLGPNSIRDKSTASKMVGILEDHGWLMKAKDGAVIGEHHRRDAWMIHGKGMG
jgi:hypothetical protein